MEIDTGALVSAVGKTTFESIKEGVKLQETLVSLKTYAGQQIALLGAALVPVQHNGRTLNLPLVVTEVDGLPFA